ncbi:MAG: phosphoribosylanthranilate isomerase [bacterium]|nr:phosphoribosylanthranilate isomerase [bacterium]
MTWVKVCGLTSAADVAAVADAGADAVGFVNVPSSPRFVTLDVVADLSRGVSPETVLLTLDLTPSDCLAALERTGVTGVQPYGRHQIEAAAAAQAAGYFVLYPAHAGPGVAETDFPGIPLLDTPSKSSLGGTGLSFDWALTEGIKYDFVLAGGLGPHNVRDAVAKVSPWGVDASSGLEQSPGVKDHSMVAEFITKAKMT